MAVIRDVMPAFELMQPASIADALELLDRHGPSAWVLAGGLDSFDWLKDRIKRPSVVVDLSGVAEMKGVRPRGEGLEIGAMTTLTDVVRHPMVQQRFGMSGDMEMGKPTSGDFARFDRQADPETGENAAPVPQGFAQRASFDAEKGRIALNRVLAMADPGKYDDYTKGEKNAYALDTVRGRLWGSSAC